MPRDRGCRFKGQKNQVRIRDNGYLGKFAPGDHLEIQAYPTNNVLPFKMHIGRVNIYHVRKKDRLVQQKIYVFADTRCAGLMPYLRHNQVTIRLLRFLPQGKITLWSLGLTAQKEDFFVVCQKNYEESFFKREGQLVCPARERDWPDVCDLVRGQAEKWWANDTPTLPRDWTKFRQGPQLEGVLSDDRARVIWWDDLRGRGVVKLPRTLASSRGIPREALVTREQIKVKTFRRERGEKIPNLKSLKPGQVITYKKVIMGPTAKKGAVGFRNYLTGVKPLKAERPVGDFAVS